MRRIRDKRGTPMSRVVSPPARASFLHLMGILAGKWPHSLALQPGGTTRSVTSSDKTRSAAILFGFRAFLEGALFGESLETIAGLETHDDLMRLRESGRLAASDFGRFLDACDTLKLDTLGRAADAFMSYGAYFDGAGHLFRQGLWIEGGPRAFDEWAITEDVSSSRMSYQETPRHPYQGVTIPDANGAGYTWCKAPRVGGRVVEVGALARQLLDGQPLIRQLVRNRVIARLVEVARVVIAMEEWIRAIRPGAPFCRHEALPDEASGCGLVEAARGSLGHWVRVRNGRILNYQIVSPTTWNFSPRDKDGCRGALEQALIGTPVGEDDEDPLAVQHVVRSFDPCMVCIDRRGRLLAGCRRSAGVAVPHDDDVVRVRGLQQVDERPCSLRQADLAVLVVVIVLLRFGFGFGGHRGFEPLDRVGYVRRADCARNRAAVSHDVQQALGHVAEHGDVGVGLACESDQHRFLRVQVRYRDRAPMLLPRAGAGHIARCVGRKSQCVRRQYTLETSLGRGMWCSSTL